MELILVIWLIGFAISFWLITREPSRSLIIEDVIVSGVWLPIIVLITHND